MLNNKDRTTLLRLVNAENASFADLTRIAGLNPQKAFQGADLRGVDFGSSDLAGYDFTDADLTGASFKDAAIDGAVFEGAALTRVTWPRRISNTPDWVEPQARPHQMAAIEQMKLSLEVRNRAIALMPAGTGTSFVLRKLIEHARNSRRHYRSLLVVRNAATRDFFVDSLRRVDFAVSIDHDVTEDGSFHEVLILNGSSYIYDRTKFRSTVNKFGPFNAIFTDSVDFLDYLSPWIEGRDKTWVVTIDNPPPDAHHPASKKISSAIGKYFVDVAYRLDAQEAVSLGILHAARLIDITPQFSLSSGRTEDNPELLRARIHNLSVSLAKLNYPPILVNCRDQKQAKFLHDTIKSNSDAVNQLHVHTIRYKNTDGNIDDKLNHRRSIVLSPSSYITAGLVSSTAYFAALTPLKHHVAQMIAYRHMRSKPEPVVLDVSGSFRGFPHLESGARLLMENPDVVVRT